MLCFTEISANEFLNHYWQKKPLVIRQALPDFINALTPDELAGLAMEEEIESRIVFETPNKAPRWHLKRGPFSESDFTRLPATHWTLLVQGVDRFIPDVYAMLDHFDFIPQWRIDDVMISYAVNHGSVGPHYDNYDVFLYQAKGRRKWSLTTKDCNNHNYLADTELRIMKQFDIEDEYILEEGDMLYLPPHVGHYGIAISEACMTYSFGYRSYQGHELWDSYAEYLAEQGQSTLLYQDPIWEPNRGTSELPQQAWLNAKKLMRHLLDNEELLKSWFGCFVTRLDCQAEALLPSPLNKKSAQLDHFVKELKNSEGLIRNPLCRFAYQESIDRRFLHLFINGGLWDSDQAANDLIKAVANSRVLTTKRLIPFINDKHNQIFLFKLWRLRWLEFIE
ncbi:MULTISPECIES: cupin domain-containing protein [Legionella]|uniref:Cupin n=1 Tax=Legionella maceachernii TaxID=466 RepID=A0A0W0WCS9_9GAMM|nr:cupin domain-containing protein [Legionella maceachernii]KTD29814.1 cupin [Legionella maceachernii]SJZ78869.1 50S ribosomal protein L16 3-hydroxylase [Legionella maceachernii]SUP02945.1 Cupin superfamily protein [Legionella maceachernii]